MLLDILPRIFLLRVRTYFSGVRAPRLAPRAAPSPTTSGNGRPHLGAWCFVDESPGSGCLVFFSPGSPLFYECTVCADLTSVHLCGPCVRLSPPRDKCPHTESGSRGYTLDARQGSPRGGQRPGSHTPPRPPLRAAPGTHWPRTPDHSGDVSSLESVLKTGRDVKVQLQAHCHPLARQTGSGEAPASPCTCSLGGVG